MPLLHLTLHSPGSPKLTPDTGWAPRHAQCCQGQGSGEPPVSNQLKHFKLWRVSHKGAEICVEASRQEEDIGEEVPLATT